MTRALFIPDPSPPCDTPHDYLDDAIAEAWEAFDRGDATRAEVASAEERERFSAHLTQPR